MRRRLLRRPERGHHVEGRRQRGEDQQREQQPQVPRERLALRLGALLARSRRRRLPPEQPLQHPAGDRDEHQQQDGAEQDPGPAHLDRVGQPVPVQPLPGLQRDRRHAQQADHRDRAQPRVGAPTARSRIRHGGHPTSAAGLRRSGGKP
jgi:hypothetical protein